MLCYSGFCHLELLLHLPPAHLPTLSNLSTSPPGNEPALQPLETAGAELTLYRNRHQVMYREMAKNDLPFPAMSVGEGYDTPSDSTGSDIYPDTPVDQYHARDKTPCVPQKDATFMIRDPNTRLVITLKDGVLGLCAEEKQQPGDSHDDPRGSHWHCVENEHMWLGFRSAVSGRYLGHDNNTKKWRFYAEGKKHDDWEYFCVRQHSDGGHILLVKHWSQFRAMKAGGIEGRELVVGGQGESGTPWEFIRVHSDI